MCESINNWALDCPDETEYQKDMWLSHEVILFQVDFDHLSELKGRLPEP